MHVRRRSRRKERTVGQAKKAAKKVHATPSIWERPFFFRHEREIERQAGDKKLALQMRARSELVGKLRDAKKKKQIGRFRSTSYYRVNICDPRNKAIVDLAAKSGLLFRRHLLLKRKMFGAIPQEIFEGLERAIAEGRAKRTAHGFYKIDPANPKNKKLVDLAIKAGLFDRWLKLSPSLLEKTVKEWRKRI